MTRPEDEPATEETTGSVATEDAATEEANRAAGIVLEPAELGGEAPADPHAADRAQAALVMKGSALFNAISAVGIVAFVAVVSLFTGGLLFATEGEAIPSIVGSVCAFLFVGLPSALALLPLPIVWREANAVARGDPAPLAMGALIAAPALGLFGGMLSCNSMAFLVWPGALVLGIVAGVMANRLPPRDKALPPKRAPRTPSENPFGAPE